MSDIRQRLNDDMKQAMRAKDKAKLSTIRMALAAVKQKEIDQRCDISDDDVINIISKMVKQRKDAFSQFSNAGREELAAKEHDEIEILTDYLPRPLTPAELKQLIELHIKHAGASSMKDMGKVMAILKPEVTGKADMTDVSKMLKQCLGTGTK